MKKIRPEQLELNPFSTIGEDNFLLTAGDERKWNTMTAGWGGFGYVWNRPCIFVFVRESRYTMEFLDRSSSFSISFFDPTERNMEVLSEAGSRSGKTFSKMTDLGLTPIQLDNTIVFSEANMCITCTKCSKVLLDGNCFIDTSLLSHYPQGDWHYMFVGSIDGIYVS